MTEKKQISTSDGHTDARTDAHTHVRSPFHSPLPNFVRRGQRVMMRVWLFNVHLILKTNNRDERVCGAQTNGTVLIPILMAYAVSPNVDKVSSTNVYSLYVLAGIAPPGVRRSVASRTERRRQADDTRHPCHNHQPAPSRLKSRKSFLHAVQPLSQPPQTTRLALWTEQRIAKQHLAKLPIPTSEQLAPGEKSEWKLWKSLNRLRTGMGRSKTNLSKWGYADAADTACECGTSEQTMQHLLRCPLLENECSLEHLATANEKALHCARAWPII